MEVMTFYLTLNQKHQSRCEFDSLMVRSTRYNIMW